MITGAAIGVNEPIGLLAIPTVDAADLNSSNPLLNNSNNNLTAYIETSDTDGDSVVSAITWNVNGTEQLALYFNFEQDVDSKNGTDYAGFTNNITTLNNNPLYVPTQGYNNSGAWNFSNVNNEIQLITTNFPIIGTSNYTVEAWIKSNSSDAYQTILALNSFDPGFHFSPGKMLYMMAQSLQTQMIFQLLMETGTMLRMYVKGLLLTN